MLKLPNPFRKLTLREVRTRTIVETELALHEAKLNEERAKATTFMFEATLKRLKDEQNANP